MQQGFGSVTLIGLLVILVGILLAAGVITLIVVLIVRACRKEDVVLPEAQPEPPPFEPQQKEQ